ncbi:MAG: TrpB-like pyridoxal phosphate-dependent enzyme [Verrucomicrobia bacterium]|jgi:tryptophan synthase beta chain|nr:TrpB-like pyridoxal phosphate-dependent enzyme [Verrucomicrobiota bacterium]
MSDQIKVVLTEDELPRQWYNLAADFTNPMPPPVDMEGNPIGPDALAPVFPMNLIEQEMCTDRWVDIPEEILGLYKIWRPTPLYRARRLEKALGTPAKIYYKNEGVSPPGSHKPNTAVAQAWYNKEFGIKRLTTETGAGQWGSALSFACELIGLECKIFMVRISFTQKPFRKMMMRVWGGDCVASPSTETEVGRKILEEMPDTPGSLGIAISEALEQAVQREDTRYALGSVMNHVMLHQTIIGLEAKAQFEKIGEYPDIVIGCAGGGSNFAGLAFPFAADKIAGKDVRIVATEPTACPTLTRAPYAYDSGDVAMMTPLLPMHTLGHTFVPAPIHAGGLRYHGMAPMVSHALREGLIEANSLEQLECYESAVLWARTEGFIPAPETSHAIAQAIREAKQAKEEGKEKVIVMNWSGHGLMDLTGYEAFFDGKLSDYSLPEELMARSLQSLEGLPKPPA